MYVLFLKDERCTLSRNLTQPSRVSVLDQVTYSAKCACSKSSPYQPLYRISERRYVPNSFFITCATARFCMLVLCRISPRMVYPACARSACKILQNFHVSRLSQGGRLQNIRYDTKLRLHSARFVQRLSRLVEIVQTLVK